MTQIISIASEKGGVGKSTTAYALGAGLSLRKNYKVLLVDLDPQGNMSYTLNLCDSENTVYDLLACEAIPDDVIQKAHRCDIIRAGRELTRLDIELKDITGKEYRLKEGLESIQSNYDYIIIDTPPSLGLLTINAFAASNSIIIPSQADVYSLQGIGQLLKTVYAVKKYCNSGLNLKGILLTRYNPRTILSRDMKEMIETTADKIGTFVYKSVIRECISIKEAQASRKDIFTYSLESNGSKDYLSFIDEMEGSF